MVPCRPSRIVAALCAALALATLSAACGSGSSSTSPDGGVACVHSFDCPTGQGCVAGTCQALPCGGCQPDQACADNGQCVEAQGAACPSAGCPTGYSCNGTVCTQPCTLDSQCPTNFVCNGTQCAQCAFDNQCTGVSGKPRCDSTSGTCVACLNPIDCAHGNYCNTTTHACVPGCEADTDCNSAAGEKCVGATSTAPGMCRQCSSDTDCPNNVAPACDGTGHCVACTNDNYCTPGVPRCNATSETCVQCLPANNATGADCGGRFYNGGPLDPHNDLTCVSNACVAGCAFDTQCGCPRRADGTEDPTCNRYPHTACFSDTNCYPGDHCVGASGQTQGKCTHTVNAVSTVTVVNGELCDTSSGTNGSCVECLTGHNTECAYRVSGSTLYSGSFANLTGSRCVADFCVEGCDTTADCASGKICHLGSPGDANNNKCVECSCAGAATQDGNSWCTDATDCPNDKTGAMAPNVCDVKTLACRKKRFNETCGASNECGDPNDPSVAVASSSSCLPVPGVCIRDFQVDTTSAFQQCSNTTSVGRCGIPCVHIGSSSCDSAEDSTGECPANSLCSTVNDASGSPYCIAPLCR